MSHKAGFVNIIGNPNVGKSTLMNCMVGEKLSIVTPRMQTTRLRIMGIVNSDDYQIVFSDTPGIIKPRYKMQEAMMKFVHTAFCDADIIIYVTDVVEQRDKNALYIERLHSSDVPVLLVINKIDLSNTQSVDALVSQWKQVLPSAEIFAVSAAGSVNTAALFDRILSLLPEHEAYFSKDDLSDKSLRFFTAEIIREKIFLQYKQEIPYSSEVQVEDFKEADTLIRIRAVIYVTRESQKAIIIGNKGKAIKQLGIAARSDIEAFLDRQVHLELFVKVIDNWKERDTVLRNFGYLS